MLIKNRAWLILALGVLLLVIVDRVYVSNLASYSAHERFKPTDKAKGDKHRANSPLLAVIADIEEFIETHEKLFIVLSTIAIAGFTGTLWRATSGLLAAAESQKADMRESLRIAKQSADAARDSADGITNANIPYLAPDLRMDSSSLRNIPATANRFRPRVVYVFRNFGRSPATVIEFSDYLVVLEALPETPVYPPHALDTDRELVIGAENDSREFPCGLVADVGNWEERRMTPDEVRAERRPFFLIGRVVYDDAFGLRHTKHFCWRFEIRPDGRLLFRPDGGRAYNRRTKEKSPYA